MRRVERRELKRWNVKSRLSTHHRYFYIQILQFRLVVDLDISVCMLRYGTKNAKSTFADIKIVKVVAKHPHSDASHLHSDPSTDVSRIITNFINEKNVNKYKYEKHTCNMGARLCNIN